MIKIITNRNFSYGTITQFFQKKVKPLCNNKLAFEKAVLLYGILRNTAVVIEKLLLGDLQSQHFSFF